MSLVYTAGFACQVGFISAIEGVESFLPEDDFWPVYLLQVSLTSENKWLSKELSNMALSDVQQLFHEMVQLKILDQELELV